MNRLIIRGLFATLLALSMVASCSTEEDGGGSGGEQQNEIEASGALIDGTGINSASQTAGALPETDDAVIAPAAKARIGSLPRSATGNRDLNRELAGEEGDLSFDIDGDGLVEELEVFIANIDDTVFMNWEDEAICHLTWSETGTSWYAFSPCGGDPVNGTIVCVYAASTTCSQCLNDTCSACEISGTEIYCGEAAEQLRQRWDEEDAGPDLAIDLNQPDVSEDPAEDVQVDREEDPVDPVDIPTTDVTSGACEPSCMNQSMAECCTSCGCDAEVQCYPICDSGFLWDCEIQCCYSYDLNCCYDDCPR